MNHKLTSRIRRSRKIRSKIRELGKPRLTVHRSCQHIYAQVIDDAHGKVLAVASTIDKELKAKLENANNKTDAAKHVGSLIGKRSLNAGIKQVAFDRSGFKYHGRIKALAEAAREEGLEF